MIKFIRRISGAVFAWSVVKVAEQTGKPRDEAKRLADREVWEVQRSVDAFIDWQTTEQEILTARLTRRFDPGMAINESTQRAIAAKKAAGEEVQFLTSRQLAAFEVQKQELARILKAA